MLNRLFISHRIAARYLKLMMAGILSSMACVWIVAACAQQPAGNQKPSAATEMSQAESGRFNQPVQLSTELDTAIERVADQAIPAVVHIVVKEHQEMANPFYAYKDNSFFRRFFGLPKDMPKKLERELVGIGSGVIIDAEGHILSNYHVVGGATQIEVTLSDGTQYPATVVGVDPKTDLGVIKINAEKPLPFLVFANSDEAKVGQCGCHRSSQRTGPDGYAGNYQCQTPNRNYGPRRLSGLFANRRRHQSGQQRRSPADP
jgi:S1-C subfamily serine protease